jgi:hypothetical protein
MSKTNLMYLVKDLDQIHLLLLTNFCLYFETERVIFLVNLRMNVLRKWIQSSCYGAVKLKSINCSDLTNIGRIKFHTISIFFVDSIQFQFSKIYKFWLSNLNWPILIKQLWSCWLHIVKGCKLHPIQIRVFMSQSFCLCW